jgi:hypothetical protein
MEKNVKVFRIGHRLPRKQGVITIASEVFPDTGEIFHGASYCHPKEKSYDKKRGIEQALDRLALAKERDKSLKLDCEISHSKVLNTILVDMFFDTNKPDWTDDLIIEQLNYPSGLKRFPVDDETFDEKFGISSIIVNSEFAKEQLSMALEYIESLKILDDGFVAIRSLLELAYNPDLIVVKK